MAGYRRFIAYVYDYESGKKGSNCGFIKVEVKDQQCSVEIHLHCPGLPENVKCNIYGFTRKDGLINGILLDTCETEKETVECLIITDATDMNDSGVAMGKLGGMIITSDTGGFFGTEWDDQPIRPENFHEIKAMPDADIPESAKITSQKPEFRQIWYYRKCPKNLKIFQKNPKIPRLQKFLTILYQLNRLPTFRLREHLITSQEQSHPISQIILLKIPIVLKMPAILSRKEMQKTEKPLPNFPPSPMAN